MYLSLDQIQLSLKNLERVHPFFGMTYLAFKRTELPVGRTENYVFTRLATDILEEHYKVSSEFQGYYSPFITSDKADRWLKPRYPSTSLQRITTDTFSDVLIHEKKTSEWGWTRDYVAGLARHLGKSKIPAFDLSVWLFRRYEWAKEVKPLEIQEYFFEYYKIGGRERRELFSESIKSLAKNWLSFLPVTEDDLTAITGDPPGVRPAQGAAVTRLELRHVGPAKVFKYEPAERLNIITGDNSLGKTFILESLWWSLTSEWLGQPVLPREDAKKTEPKIICQIQNDRGREAKVEGTYNWDTQRWNQTKRPLLPGLVIYARYDGSFAVWDPTRSSRNDGNTPRHLFFKQQDVWDGLKTTDVQDKTQWLCNGLIRDWVTWQTGRARNFELYARLVSCLKGLSPEGVEPLSPAEPVRLPHDIRDFPALEMPYGRVPIINASAGVQRIVALAYILVWAWSEHLNNASLARQSPQRRVIVLIDEIEAHLHPRWQRVITPALLEVISRLGSTITPQVHLATHSPLVLASSEPIFDEKKDDLHHLTLKDSEVVLEELPFVRQGRSDFWLMSDVFELDHARSLPAEEAIEDAKKLQLAEDPSNKTVAEVHQRLIRYLADDDEFWVRWRFFAQKHLDKK